MQEKKKTSAAPLILSLVVFAAAAAVEHFVFSHMLLRVLAMAALVIFVTGLLILILSALKPKSSRGRTMVTLISSMARYVAVIVILCWGLTLLGVDVRTIVASVGIVALIVGFGAESLIADVVTGFFMLFEEQYNVGDIVEVNGFRGTVKAIGIRTTLIVDAGDNIKIINNSNMKDILNRSDNLSRAVSDICIPYETDLEALEKKLPALLDGIFRARPELFLSAPRYLGVQSLADSAVVLRFVADVAEKDIFSGARALNRDLWLGFRKLGVECPFPQVDVHER